jgi:hypothetical protein
LQLSRTSGAGDELIWYKSPPAKKQKGNKAIAPSMKDQAIASNEVKNSRGFIVMGDKRSAGNGWGHIAAPTISVAGENLYVPVMNGTVYVVKWNSPALDQHALLAINDLGPAGQSWTRASLSFDGGHIFAHTIGHLICIGQ